MREVAYLSLIFTTISTNTISGSQSVDSHGPCEWFPVELSLPVNGLTDHVGSCVGRNGAGIAVDT